MWQNKLSLQKVIKQHYSTSKIIPKGTPENENLSSDAARHQVREIFYLSNILFVLFLEFPLFSTYCNFSSILFLQ